MGRVLAEIIVAIGLGVIFLILGVWLKTIPMWTMVIGLATSALLVLLGAWWMFRPSKRLAGQGHGQAQANSPGAQQASGRDINQVQVTIAPTVPVTRQPISPDIDGVIRGPNIFMRIQNTDGQPHRFKVVFHNVSGAVGAPRVRDLWLPWDCGDFQMIGPKQSGMIQVAQANGEDKRVGKVIRFIHDKGKPYDGRLSEYVAFGGELHLDLELQSDAELAIQGQRLWTLTVDSNGTPVAFTPS